MQIDSHQHFWAYNDSDYVWMDDTMEVLRHDYLPDDLVPELRCNGFDGTIAVQARQMEIETEWLLELADQHDFIFGVVGWFDFTSPRLSETLERLSEFPKLRGVRELIHDMPDVDYATSDVHKRAIARLTPLGLAYDLLIRPQHLLPVLELVREFPGQPFVVDHLAKPKIASRQLEPWRTDLAALADFENVYCKLSGMVTEAAWGDWQPELFRPYLEVALEAFGANRLMIGSDWPVCTLSRSYADTMQIVVEFAGRLSGDERKGILGLNAAEFYGVSSAAIAACDGPV